MHFIRYQPLKQQLRDRSLSQREALPYYVLLCVTAALCSAPTMTYSANEWDVLNRSIQVAMAIVGPLYCYVRNGGNSGYDFIQKAVILGWVVVCRCLLVWVPIAVIVGLVKLKIAGDLYTTTWYDVTMLTLFGVFYYLRLGRHLTETDGPFHNLDTAPQPFASADSGPPARLVLDATWSGTWRIWWALCWRTLLIVIPAFVITAGVSAFALGFAGVPDHTLGIWAPILACFSALAISVVPVRMVLGKSNEHRPRVLIPKDESTPQ